MVERDLAKVDVAGPTPVSRCIYAVFIRQVISNAEKIRKMIIAGKHNQYIDKKDRFMILFQPERILLPGNSAVGLAYSNAVIVTPCYIRTYRNKNA